MMLSRRHVGCYRHCVCYWILYVGCCTMHAFCEGTIRTIESSMLDVTWEDRQQIRGTMTGNEDGEPGLGTMMGSQDMERRQGTKTGKEDGNPRLRTENKKKRRIKKINKFTRFPKQFSQLKKDSKWKKKSLPNFWAVYETVYPVSKTAISTIYVNTRD